VNLVLADSGFFENKLKFDCNGAMAIIRKWLLVQDQEFCQRLGTQDFILKISIAMLF